jgi:hypothetical protein
MKKILILSAAVALIAYLAVLSYNPRPTHSVDEPAVNTPSVAVVVPDTRPLEFTAPKDGDVVEFSSALIGKRAILENCHDVAVTAETAYGRETLTTTKCDQVLRFDEPYDSMSRIELEILAETDAAAATVLADRLAQKHGAGVEIVTRVYLHALALSAHPDAFESLYNYVNGGHGVVYTNGELNVSRAADAYVWSRVGNNFGYTTDDMVEVYRQALVEQGRKPDELEPEVDHWTRAIADRQEAIGQRGVQ